MTTREEQRFAELEQHDAYPAIRSLVAAYIGDTIVNPATTQPEFWNVTALPATARAQGRRRLLTLNVGGLETLYVTEFREAAGIAVELTVNLDVPAGWTDEQLNLESEGVQTSRPDYRSARVWCWRIDLATLLDDDVDFQTLLAGNDFEDLAASLNAGLMSRGQSPYARNNNPALVRDLLAELDAIRAAEAGGHAPQNP
ncbi:hypothetical protein [Nocardia sp. NPDC057668]|uniref:hypothetical protein n=1 Tax=Nocardia sp. NPDC057668 TaxID=3346202 RepID=UPI00366F564B